MPKKTKITLSSEQEELYKELKKLSKRANQRIVRLERSFGKDKWATRYLKEKLEVEPLQAWTSKGRVRVNKSMSEIQMRATIAAVNDFLKNKTSTRTGIKKAKKKAIETIQRKFSTEIKEITYDEAEVLSNFFDDDDVNDITNFIPGSDVRAVVVEAKEKQMEYDIFDSIMKSIKRWNGKYNFDNLLKTIYRKYIFRGIGYIEEIINNANDESELDSIKSKIDSLVENDIISNMDYNYLINLIDEKRNIIKEIIEEISDDLL